MHRTTTTATLLLTAAVSALTGCTTVQPPPYPGPVTDGTHASAPRLDGPADPRAARAPAQETPRSTASSAPGRLSDGPRRRAPAPTPTPTPHAAAPSAGPARTEAPRNQHGNMPRPRAVTPGVPGGAPDVCSLGKRYGGWQPGSPQALICERAYGR